MSGLPRAKVATGQRYSGNQQFAGNGTKRSCGKCGKHVPIGQLKSMKPWGLGCMGCRGEKA